MMSEYAKCLDVLNSCKTSAQNNTAFAYILTYEKEMNRRNKVENSYSLIKWNKEYYRIKAEVECLHEALDLNMLSIIH